MTTAVRDAWADARTAVTEPLLEGEVAAVRRRLWLRRAGVLVLELAVVLGLYLALDAAFGHSTEELWDAPLGVDFAGFGLAGVGFVVMGVGDVRSSYRGTDRPLVRPELFLPRPDRAWVRRQIAGGRPVPGERRVVVTDAARRLAAETARVPTFVGQLLLYLGLVVATPFPSTVVLVVVLSGFTLVQAVRSRVWADRARRWLALHPEA